MSSVLATHPPCLHDFGRQPDLRTSSCLPITSHARRDHHRSSFDSSLAFAGGLPTPPISNAMTGDMVAVARNLQHTHVPTSRYQHVSAASTVSMQPSLSQSSYKSSYDSPNSYHTTRSSITGPMVEREKNTAASHPQATQTVNKSKGSLAEFAAEITCLLWFESSQTLEVAEKTPKDGYVNRGLVGDSIPSPGFRKWVTTILSTTQVSKEVILLALMFIYRLKKYNPTVSGKRGSEFRLLTIALMLGNKFLDDNTYTNKTWAEVSGIPVTEIHIMEVEFLSNMRYDLYASESAWYKWKANLDRLGAFYEKAAALPPADAQPITPTTQSFAHKLPSPPSTHGTSMQIPPAKYTSIPNPVSTAPQLPRSPLRQRQTSDLTRRKRSLDYGSETHSAKRVHYSAYDMPAQQSGQGLPTPQSYLAPGSLALPAPAPAQAPAYSSSNNQTGMSSDTIRLPVPRLPAQMAENQLAPLNVPVSRAMASLYSTPSSTSTVYAQPITPLSAGPSLFPNQIPNLGIYPAPHHHSNNNNNNTTGLPSHASPTAYVGTATPTLPGLSPSHFLGDRQSPYRPVRNVNTLLIPPPSTTLQNSVRNIQAEQIRYQPLGKANHEYRSGPLPNQTENFHQSNTPLAQKYPYRF